MLAGRSEIREKHGGGADMSESDCVCAYANVCVCVCVCVLVRVDVCVHAVWMWIHTVAGLLMAHRRACGGRGSVWVTVCLIRPTVWARV